jgi:hypothetical protein
MGSTPGASEFPPERTIKDRWEHGVEFFTDSSLYQLTLIGCSLKLRKVSDNLMLLIKRREYELELAECPDVDSG